MANHQPVAAAQLVPPQVAITRVSPELEGGRFPIKRIEGDSVTVTADIFADGHDALTAVVRSRRPGDGEWLESSMRELGNDRWTGTFVVGAPGLHEYGVEAWVDRFKTWRRDLDRKLQAGQDVSLHLQTGAKLASQAGSRAAASGAHADGDRLREYAESLGAGGALLQNSPLREARPPSAQSLAFDEELRTLMERHPDKSMAVSYDRRLLAVVDRQKARFSTWYEMFPRSWGPEPGCHGTFKDCESHLPYIAAMGFDVLYLPPIHPIGRTHRKGKNNSPLARPEDAGSPWAIGAEEGGHKSIHPQLGTLDDFKHFLAAAREQGLEVALDLAYQCSPDHPYVVEHPEWFRRRPDGSVQFAENPPKKYEDIYPLDFQTEDWRKLWEELKGIVLFWIDQGVRIFRVDNPHTKPFLFWEWLIREIKSSYPGVIFLAEAFTRPKVMQRLAKLGFTQSYTYFAWRNTKPELTSYFTELTQTDMREYLRPSLWPNTPDILTEYLQYGGRPAFMIRLVLAATLAASYGIYGPAFELCENRPRETGSEEYLDAEKYEIRQWDLERPGSLKDIITRVNRARRENPALQSDENLHFQSVDNDQIIAFSKSTDDRSNVVLIIVNLDPHNTQSGWVQLALDDLGLDADSPFLAHDLLTDARYLWHGRRNYVRLDPGAVPAHLFRIRRHVRRENDFDYFM
ncbi:MAG: alpha-1,4-glucan--maltose-1-phosphate maltosyltransferase [Terriglobia bacterium]